MPYLKEARTRGATIVVVDPRATPVARQADVHLAIRPGTDVVVALAIHRHLFESGAADEAFLAAHTTGAAQLRDRALPWTFERAAEVSGLRAADIERVATSMPPVARRWSSAAGDSSATATAATPRWRCWRCRPSAASSACAAAATR